MHCTHIKYIIHAYVLIFCYSRVLKQAMKAGGGNLTPNHIEDLSLCALFLMSAAKQVDQAYNAHQSYKHTTRDADRDVNKIVAVLLDKQAVVPVEDRTSPTFEDPTPNGLKKMCNTSWIQETLSRNPTEDLSMEEENHIDEFDYEICDAH